MDAFLSRVNLDQLATRVIEFLPNLMVAVAIIILFWLLYRATRRSIQLILARAGFHPTLIGMLLDNVYRVVIMAFGLVMAADQLNINVGAALAGLGVAGIAVGFAAQDTLANMIAGFLIFWDKPFEVDDYVKVSDQYGRVAEITMRTTRIRTNNNTYVVIPNKNIIDDVLVNHSKHGVTRVDVAVGIAYKESIPEARRVLLEAVQGLPGVIDNPGPDVVVDSLGDSSVNLLVRVWIDDAARERPVQYGVVEQAKLALDRAGIEIPFPHLQLFMDTVEDRVWNGLERTGLAVAGRGGAAHPPAGGA